MANSEKVTFLLEEYMHKHSPLIKRSVPETETLEAAYSEILDENICDDFTKDIYKCQIKIFIEQYDIFREFRPAHDAVLAVMEKIREKYAPYDHRDQKHTVYHVEVVLMVILLAGITGRKDSRGYADFWFDNNPLLQFIIPGMPSPKHMISESTINMILCMLPKDGFEQLFTMLFSRAVTHLKDIIKAARNDDLGKDQNFTPAYGGDGHELRPTCRKGEQDVTVMNCEHCIQVDHTLVQFKNSEVNAFERIFDRMNVDEFGTFIFYADAINTGEDFITYLNGKNIPWIFSINTDNGNKSLLNAVKKAFITHPDSYKHVETIKTSGTVETRTYCMLPITAVDADNTFTAKCVLMVKKHTEYYIKDAETQRKPSDSVIFYISSLEYSEQSFKQLFHSLGRRRLYESSHCILDVDMFQEQSVLSNEDYMAEVTGFNKCIYNVITYIRQKITENGYDLVKHRKPVKKRPVSYSLTYMQMRENPLSAWTYIMDYFLEHAVIED